MSYIPGVQLAATIADLRALQPAPGSIAILLAKTTLGDNLGGFYYWDATSTAAEDLAYMNVLAAGSAPATGRWVRTIQKAAQLTQGVLVNQAGVRTFYAPGVTDASGKVVVYLTTDGTATGPAIFAEVWQVTPQQSPTAAPSGAPTIGYGVVSADLKTLTCTFSQSATTTLGATLLALAGTVIKGLAAAPAGVAVQLKVEGR